MGRTDPVKKGWRPADAAGVKEEGSVSLQYRLCLVAADGIQGPEIFQPSAISAGGG